MQSVFSVYSAALLASSLVPLYAAAYTWRRRSAPGSTWMIWLLLAAAEWSMSSALSMAHLSLGRRILAAQFSYLGSTSVAVFLLLMTLEYVGFLRHASARMVLWLLALPLASSIGAFTNQYHGLAWPLITPSRIDPNLLVYAHGPVFWAVATYDIALTIVAIVVLIRFALGVRPLRRKQTVWMILAAALPVVGELVYLAVGARIPWYDSSMTMGVSGAILAFNLQRNRFLELLPVARETLVERMPEGMLITDAYGVVADVNLAAQRILGFDRSAIGLSAQDALVEWPGLAEAMTEATEPQFEIPARGPSGAFVMANVWPIEGSDADALGHAALIRDLTQQVSVEQSVDDVRQRLSRFAREIDGIQQGLQERAADRD